MKDILIRSAQVLSILMTLTLVLHAHGGQYTGPAGGGSTGGFAPAGVGTPGPGPGPAGGGTKPGEGGTTAPIGGGVTGLGNPGPVGPPRPGGGPTPTGGTAVPTGGTTARRGAKTDPIYGWDAWWFFNDDRYLQLKAKLRAEENETTNIDLDGGYLGFGDEVTRVNAKMIREQINPVLRYGLKDPFHDTRAAALIALGKTGAPAALADLMGLANDPHQQVRESSFLAMGILGNRQAIPILIEVMNDSTAARKLVDRPNGVDNRARAFAALGIGLIGAREVDLSDTEAVSALLAMMKARENEKQRDLQIAPIVALGLMKARVAVPDLIAYVENKSNSSWQRAYAATSLARIGDPSALPTLVAGLKDKQNAVVQSCAMGLGLLGKAENTEVVAALQKLLKTAPDLGAKNFAIMSLAEIGGPDNRNLLARLAGKGNLRERSFAALGLGVYLYKNPRDESRDELGDQLHRLFRSEKNPDLRGASAIALGLAENEAAGPDLLEALADSSQPALRGHLCTALGLMRHRDGIPEIRRAVSYKGDIDLRRSAAIALGLMGDRDAVRFLEKEIAASENSMAVQGAVTQGLGFIGDRSAVPTLTAFLKERDRYQDLTRAFAAVALGLLGDKDDLPVLAGVAAFNNYLIRTDAIGEALTIL